jgi:hypothetical protein
MVFKVSFSSVLEHWKKRLDETGALLREIYKLVGRGEMVVELLELATRAEKTQSYLWTYVDYGFRAPIYRTIQWLGFNVDQSFWGNMIKASNKTNRTNKTNIDRRVFIDRLHVHLLKEHTLVWIKVMDSLARRVERDRDREELLELIKSVIGHTIAEDPSVDPALKDLKGIATELKACYVLIDHEKPFLPFSIMQAPITPSYIRPGATSGDLFLFEENLVVDVKGGWLDRETGYPVYMYKRRGLSHDLKNVSDMHTLYGIRKGIGVVAEDGKHIYLAVYVPWRRWRIQGPLLLLKSLKLPLLIYMNNVNDRGVELPKAIIKDGKLSFTLIGYVLEDRPEEEVKEVKLQVLESPGIVLKPSISRNGRRLTLEFSIDANTAYEGIIEVGKKHVMLAELHVTYGGAQLKYPLVVVVNHM